MVSRLLHLQIVGIPPLGLLAAPKPGRGNTGVRGDYRSLTPYTGPAVLSTPGATFEGMDFTSSPVVAADDITFDHCRIKVSSGWLYALRHQNSPRGLRLVDTEIDGSGTDWDRVTEDGSQPGTGDGPSAAIQPGIGYTAQRCHFHSCGDLLKPHDNPETDPILVEDCLLDRPVFPKGAHADVLQIAGSGAYNLTVRRCTLNGLRTDIPGVPKRYASSSLVQFGSFPKATDGSNKGVLRNLLFEDLWVDGGGYGARLTIAATGAAECTDVIFRRVRFGLNHQYGAFTPPLAGLRRQSADRRGLRVGCHRRHRLRPCRRSRTARAVVAQGGRFDAPTPPYNTSEGRVIPHDPWWSTRPFRPRPRPQRPPPRPAERRRRVDHPPARAH